MIQNGLSNIHRCLNICRSCFSWVLHIRWASNWLHTPALWASGISWTEAWTAWTTRTAPLMWLEWLSLFASYVYAIPNMIIPTAQTGNHIARTWYGVKTQLSRQGTPHYVVSSHDRLRLQPDEADYDIFMQPNTSHPHIVDYVTHEWKTLICISAPHEGTL
jgi:hypothetical protein